MKILGLKIHTAHKLTGSPAHRSESCLTSMSISTLMSLV